MLLDGLNVFIFSLEVFMCLFFFSLLVAGIISLIKRAVEENSKKG